MILSNILHTRVFIVITFWLFNSFEWSLNILFQYVQHPINHMSLIGDNFMTVVAPTNTHNNIALHVCIVFVTVVLLATNFSPEGNDRKSPPDMLWHATWWFSRENLHIRDKKNVTFFVCKTSIVEGKSVELGIHFVKNDLTFLHKIHFQGSYFLSFILSLYYCHFSRT